MITDAYYYKYLLIYRLLQAVLLKLPLATSTLLPITEPLPSCITFFATAAALTKFALLLLFLHLSWLNLPLLLKLCVGLHQVRWLWYNTDWLMSRYCWHRHKWVLNWCWLLWKCIENWTLGVLSKYKFSIPAFRLFSISI